MSPALSSEQLREVAKILAERARDVGCEGIVIALSTTTHDTAGRPEHSNYYVWHSGPCLVVEGLDRRIHSVVSRLWDTPSRVGGGA